MSPDPSPAGDAEEAPTPVEERALLRTWPALVSRIPWVPLGVYPTPVEPLPRVATACGQPGLALYAKRDDQSARPYGGNKVRTLEVLMARTRAKGIPRILATGAYGSNHALATTIHAPRAGLDSAALLWPQSRSETAMENLRVLLTVSPRVRAVPLLLMPFAYWQETRDRSQWVMPPGGATPHGVLGYISGGLELALQVAAGELPAPKTVLVGLGSTCTSAGLLVGMVLAARRGIGFAGTPPKLLSVRVTPWPITAKWRVVGLAVRASALLAKLLGDESVALSRRDLNPFFDVDGRQLGPGYGEPTAAGREAIEVFDEHAGFRLDTTYSAKAVAGLLVRLRSAALDGPVVYWSTKSTMPLPDAPMERWAAGPKAMVRWLTRGTHLPG